MLKLAIGLNTFNINYDSKSKLYTFGNKSSRSFTDLCKEIKKELNFKAWVIKA